MNAAPRLPGLQQSRCLPGSGRSNGRQASRRLPFMLPKEKSPVSVGWGASLSNRGSGLLLRSVISGWSVSTGWSDLANGGPASRWVRVLLFARGATSAILNWSSQRPRCARFCWSSRPAVRSRSAGASASLAERRRLLGPRDRRGCDALPKPRRRARGRRKRRWVAVTAGMSGPRERGRRRATSFGSSPGCEVR